MPDYIYLYTRILSPAMNDQSDLAENGYGRCHLNKTPICIKFKKYYFDFGGGQLMDQLSIGQFCHPDKKKPSCFSGRILFFRCDERFISEQKKKQNSS
jgi:hypothetical protein